MSSDQPRILIVDDERLHLNQLNEMLKADFAIKVALNGEQALERAQSEPRPDLILLDIRMPDMDGFEVLSSLKQLEATSDIPVIFLTAMDSEEDETRGLKLGAVDYISKSSSPSIVKTRINTHLKLRQSLRESIEARLQQQSLRQQVDALNRSLSSRPLQHPEAFAGIISDSPVMKALFHYMEAIANSGEWVLITGETGVGKELIAHALHQLANRNGEMVAINLAGLDDNAFSDTLFGHKKGAYTGANQDRKGLIAKAKGGSLFLDEVGDLEPASQIKLLRLLQERVYYPLGSDSPVEMTANVIAATNRDLNELMRLGEFRQDLYYRLSAHQVKIPPLRQRREDIPLLTRLFLQQAAKTMDQRELKAPAELFKLLEVYDFPGNIRELRAMILDAVAQHQSGPVLSMKAIQRAIEERREAVQSNQLPIREDQSAFPLMNGQLPTLEQAETALIAEAMQRADNNQGIAASLLGISRSALNRRLNRKLQHLLNSE